LAGTSRRQRWKKPVRRQIMTMAFRRDRLNPSQGASI
jgi:hypothetical protein